MESKIQDFSKIVFSTTPNRNSLNMALRSRDQCQRVTRHASGSANQSGEVKVVKIPLPKRKCGEVVPNEDSEKSSLSNKNIYTGRCLSDDDTNLRQVALEPRTNMLNCENQKNERHDGENLDEGKFDITSNKKIYDEKANRLLNKKNLMRTFSECVKKNLGDKNSRSETIEVIERIFSAERPSKLLEMHRKSVAKLLEALFRSGIKDDPEINKRLKSKAVDLMGKMLLKERKTVSIYAKFAKKIGSMLEMALYDEDLRGKVVDIMYHLFSKVNQVEVMMKNSSFVIEIIVPTLKAMAASQFGDGKKERVKKTGSIIGKFNENADRFGYSSHKDEIIEILSFFQKKSPMEWE